MKIKDTPKVDRPQEKLFKYGPKKLKDAELLAIILRTGVKGENVIELSRKIIRKFSKRFGNLSVAELGGIKGLGKIKAAQLVSAFELAKRYRNSEKDQILSPKAIFESVIDIRKSKKEQLVAIYLDSRNIEIQREVISIGTIGANLIHPREVFEPAVKNLASGIIIVHNHPSSDTEPSKDDLVITEQFVKAGKIMGIDILDHIIVSESGFYSFADRGKLSS